MADIRIRAERRLGALLKAQKETVGLRAGARDIGKRDGLRGSATELRNDVPTLAEAGIDKKLSSRAQRLAAVPEEEFEGELRDWRDRCTTSSRGTRTGLAAQACRR